MTKTLQKNGQSKIVARPLTTLVPLIKETLADAYEAGLDYYIKIGGMLHEAKAQVELGKWKNWLAQNFHLSASTASNYMMAFNKRRSRSSFRTASEAWRPNASAHHQPAWQSTVKDRVAQARKQSQIFERDELSRKQESDALQKLAHRLIDIGYKVLSIELHPDKGGSHEAMLRLNEVRTHLRSAVEDL